MVEPIISDIAHRTKFSILNKPITDRKFDGAAVVYEGIYKNFGKVQALCGINMEVTDGEFTALVGLSGCGRLILPAG